MKTNLEPWQTMKTKWNYENYENLPGCKLFSQREKSSDTPVAVVALVAMQPEALLALFLTLSRGGGGLDA